MKNSKQTTTPTIKILKSLKDNKNGLILLAPLFAIKIESFLIVLKYFLTH